MAVYSPDSFTALEIPTLAKMNKLWTNDASMNDGNGIGTGVIGNRQVAAGVVVQVVGTVYNGMSSGSGVIPQDDTIPQISEGTEVMTQTITPKASTNQLVIHSEIYMGSSGNFAKLGAIFQDANANALAAKYIYQGNWTDPTTMTLVHIMTAGTTSPTTFRVRVGSSGGPSTFTFNGALGNRTMGTASKSSIMITEVKV